MGKTTEQRKVDDWNERHAIGTPVSVRKDGGEIVRTVTRSAAQLCSGHTAVIWCEGIRGCYLLDRVSIRDEEA